MSSSITITEENYLDIVKQLDKLFDRKVMIEIPEVGEFPFTPKIVKGDAVFEVEEDYCDEEDIYEGDDEDDIEKYGDIYEEEEEDSEDDFLFMVYDKYNLDVSLLVGVLDELEIDKEHGVIFTLTDVENNKREILVKFKDYTDEQYNQYIAESIVNNINNNVDSPKYFSYRVVQNKIEPKLIEEIRNNIRKKRLVTTIETEYGDFLFKINILDFILFGTETKKLFSIDCPDINIGERAEITDENYAKIAESLKDKWAADKETEYGILSNEDTEFQIFNPIVTCLHDEEGFDVNITDKYGNTEILLTKGDWIKKLDDKSILIYSDMPSDEDGTNYSPTMFLVSPHEFSKEEKDIYLESSLTDYVEQILEKDFDSDDIESITDSIDIISYMNRGKRDKNYSTFVTLENGKEVRVEINVEEFKKKGIKAENIISIKEVSLEEDEDEDDSAN